MLLDIGMCIMIWLEEIFMVKKSFGGDFYIKRDGIFVGKFDLNFINEINVCVVGVLLDF